MPDAPEGQKSKAPELSRRARLKKEIDIDPEMPPVDADYLINYLFEIGPTLPTGMGNAPLTHAEITAWQNNTGIELDAWEARTLRSLSWEYLDCAQRASAPEYPAPWEDAPYAKPTANLIALRMQQQMIELANL